MGFFIDTESAGIEGGNCQSADNYMEGEMSMETVLEMYKRLFDGLKEDDMTHLPEISSYNHNFYSINGKLLFGKSDDDNFTQWYWVKGAHVAPIGGSYCSDGDKIIVDVAYT